MKLLILSSLLLATASAGTIGFGGGFFGVKPPIYLDDAGNVGVNFGGYQASAGLGGLLNGGAAGGLHAEAQTPYGQVAKAGLGGVVDKGGRTAGGLYAGASAGGDIAAEAGLGGEVSGGGAIGGSFGHATKVVTKTVDTPVIVEHEIHEKPTVQRTYVERTVIPNYVEKTIQVPSYVEKTVRVPTYIQKTVRVPAPPTVIEKTVEVPNKPMAIDTRIDVEGAVGGGESETVHVDHKVVTHHGHGKGGLFGGLFASAGIGGSAAGGGAGGGGGVYRAQVTKVANANLINDIFNIPISTLRAVNQLVGGLAGGASGSVAVSKHYGTY